MRFEVYYAKDISHHALDQPVMLDTLSATHVLVRTVEAESLGQVYTMMQAERWKEATPELIETLGLGHTSMSVGDVIKDEQGQYWQCVNRGWRTLPYPAWVRIVLDVTRTGTDKTRVFGAMRVPVAQPPYVTGAWWLIDSGSYLVEVRDPEQVTDQGLKSAGFRGIEWPG